MLLRTNGLCVMQTHAQLIPTPIHKPPLPPLRHADEAIFLCPSEREVTNYEERKEIWVLIRNGMTRDGLEIVLAALPSSYLALDPP